MAQWGRPNLSLHCWMCVWSAVTSATSAMASGSTGAAAAGAAALSLPRDNAGGPLDWLLSDKGPFHHSPDYMDFVEKNRQGFSTRYKIYR